MKLTLKAARLNAGFTQETAAKQLGISESTLGSYERGITFPDVPLIKKIEDLYGVEYRDIIFLPKNAVKPQHGECAAQFETKGA